MTTLAERQLAAWQAIAETWPVSWDAQYGGDQATSGRDRSWRCGDCGKGVALAVDEHWRRYQYSPEQWLALVVLHVRSYHASLDPN